MTYGVNAPLGLQAVSYGGSSPWNGGIQVYNITPAYGTSLYLGDLVTLTNGLLIRFNPANSATNPPVGVFWGCSFRDSAGNYQFLKYWPAGQTTFTNNQPVANVITDAKTVFSIQANAAFPWANIGNNANVSFATAGNPATGESGMTLDVSTLATTATLPLTVVGFDTVPGNAPTNVTGAGSTSAAYANVLVKLNNTNFNAGATGA